MIEVWKEKVLPYNSAGLEVSNLGRVRKRSGEPKTVYDNGGGYKKVVVWDRCNSKTNNYYIHRLVSELFLPTAKDCQTQVNHKDGDKGRNMVNNLEWVSPKGNVRHMHENGLNKGRRNHGKIFKASDSTVAYAYSKVVMGISGISETAREYGLPRTTLSSIVNKRSRIVITDAIDLLL